MARRLRTILEPPRRCSYLPDRQASLEHHILLDVEPAELDHLLERGYRRFGPDYFRPACGACSACIPTRLPTATFAPSKSQRRAARKCASLVRRVGPPVVDDERLALYAAWHRSREAARGWPDNPVDAESYHLQFAFPHPSAREITYRQPDSGRLVGVALSDEGTRAWSAVYFFYAPSWGARSIGVANVMAQVELARERGLPHVYLGYFVEGCPSLAYKGGYHPQARLVGRPGLGDEPRWVTVDA